MSNRDKGLLSVVPLMIYRAQGGRRLTNQELIEFISRYKDHCDSLKNEPMDKVFEYTGTVSNLNLLSEELAPPKMETEERRQHVAEMFQRIAREIRS